MESKVQVSLKLTNITCSLGHKVVCVDDKFSKPFKSYLGEHAVYNFISSVIEESEYCSDVMKEHLNKKLVMMILRTLLNVGSVIEITLMVMVK